MTPSDEATPASVINWENIPATQVRPGVRRRIYATDLLMICHHELELGMQTNPHRHAEFDQLVHIAQGSADYFVDGVPHTMTAGSFLLVPRGSEHYVVPTQTPCINIDYFVPPRPDLLSEAVG